MLIHAMEAREGAGAKIYRLFPTPSIKHFDPFVVMDEFFLTPADGIPTHPHMGFEAVTYALDGSFRHADNLGNDTIVRGGGVQYFNAGSGLEHSEMPADNQSAHGIQLWVNLPRSRKGMSPDYHQVDAGDIPVRNDNGIREATIIGGESPVKLNTTVHYRDISLDAGAGYDPQIPDNHSGILYVLEGSVILGERLIPAHAAWFFRDSAPGQIAAGNPARFVLISAPPHNEPIRQMGPYVL
jgi:redox-sensitive bicupin YhaK (pirin superfamily)